MRLHAPGTSAERASCPSRRAALARDTSSHPAAAVGSRPPLSSESLSGTCTQSEACPTPHRKSDFMGSDKQGNRTEHDIRAAQATGRGGSGRPATSTETARNTTYVQSKRQDAGTLEGRADFQTSLAGPVNVQTSLAGTRQWALWGRARGGKKGTSRAKCVFWCFLWKNAIAGIFGQFTAIAKRDGVQAKRAFCDHRRDFWCSNILNTENSTDSGDTPKNAFFQWFWGPCPAPYVTFLFF